MEGPSRNLEEWELTAELSKPADQIDFDGLLRRAGSGQERVYSAVIGELGKNPGGRTAQKQAVEEFFESHGPDDASRWWVARRMNELLGSPLKLSRLSPEDRAARRH